ncbi:hypothetical protein BH23ACT11_BH23ACT11_01170 [soil metagenome]
MMDQGLFAVSNFVLNVLLARWLTPQEYGTFAVAYAAFWLFIVLHSALLTEPMLVFGSGRYKNRLSEYLGVLLYGNLAFAALGSFLLLLAGLGLGLSRQPALSAALLGLALAGPFIFFQWLMRRACYVQHKPHLAALGGALYMAVVLLGIYVSYQRDWLSTPVAFYLMGLASLIVGIWLTTRLRVEYPRTRSDGLVRDTFKSHWSFGRWATLANMLALITGTTSGGIYYLVLPIFGDLEAAAALKALMNLVMPVLHANVALAVLLVPTLVQARGSARFKHLMRFSGALCFSASASYLILLILFHRPLMIWLYGGKYMEYANLVWVVGLIPLVAALTGLMAAALRACERPDRMFLAYLISALVALTAGMGFLVAWGVAGAVAAVLVSSIVAGGSMVWLFVSLNPETDEGVGPR